jgi:hypothetical protein
MLQSVQDHRMPVLPLGLMAAGALPFIAAALLSVTRTGLPGMELSLTGIAGSYALVIGIFLCGIHWGQQLSLGSPGFSLFATSNLATLALWACWLLMPGQMFLLAAILHFWVLWLVDARLRQTNRLLQDYFLGRTVVTIVVSISLLAVYLTA